MVDKEWGAKYLYTITEESISIDAILEHTDGEIISSRHLINSLKYSLIVISEAMANTLQHLLAKKHSVAVKGYTDAFAKAEEWEILTNDLSKRLKPFISFRNMLVHQYWMVDDRLFIENVRKGYGDFKHFIAAIQKKIN